jgi:hypothetical protein
MAGIKPNSLQGSNLISSWDDPRIFRTFFRDKDKNENPIPFKNSYVLFLDILGMQGFMKQSLERSLNFVFKFHTILEKHKTSDLKICTVLDGAYIATDPDKQAGEKPNETTPFWSMYRFIQNVFLSLASDFVNAKRHEFQYLVRGALSFGKIAFGRDIPAECFHRDINNPVQCPDWDEYVKHLIVGPAVISAYSGEKKAPPFGIHVDEALRETVFNEILHTSDVHPWLWWWKDLDQHLRDEFNKKVKNYFAFYEKHSYSSEYELSRLKEHEAMFSDYTAESVDQYHQGPRPGA